MRLSPVSSVEVSSSPTYPCRRIKTPSWLQRAVAVASIAMASMGLVACDGLRVSDDEEIVIAPGVMVEPSWPFTCGDQEPEQLATLARYETNMGNLCGEEEAWSAIDVDETMTYRFTLLSGSEHASIALIDPDDEQKAQLDIDSPTLDVELTPGRWTIAVMAVDPLGNPDAYFELSVEPLP